MDIPDRTIENKAISHFPLSPEDAAQRYSYFCPADELSAFSDKDLYYVDYHRHFTPFASDVVARSLAQFIHDEIVTNKDSTDTAPSQP